MFSFLLFFFSFIILGDIYSQTAASATWLFASDATATSTGSVSPSTATNTGFSNISYSTYGSFRDPSGWWTAKDITKYVEYQVQPTTGNNFTITSVSVGLSASVSALLCDIAYSTDGTNFTNINSANITLNSSTTQTTYTSGSGSMNAINVTVNSGSTFYIRLYPWLVAGSSSKYLRVKNMVISGTTIASAAALSVSTPTAFTYVSGLGPSASQSLPITGTLLTAGTITVTPATTDYEVSTDNITFTPTVSFANAAGASTMPLYVRLKSGLAVTSYNTTVSISGGGASAISVNLTGSVTAAAVPTLSVTPSSLSGFTYVTGLGSSVAKTFSVSGTLLTTAVVVTIIAPTNFEVSTDGLSYGTTSTIANTAGGTLAATTIYTRLKSGLAVSSYSGNVTVSGGGASTSLTVALVGTVTAAPLSAPVVGMPSSAISSGFTANWSTVTNASGGYLVDVYQGTTLVETIAVTGQTSTSTVVTGLSASTAYTYKVIAVGDGTTYSNSVESSSSSSITTSAAPVVSAPISCLTEDFESVVKASSATGLADNFMVTSDQDKTLVINSGTWTMTSVRLDQSNYNSTTNGIRLSEGGSSSVTTPILDNPQSISFYIKASSAYSGALADGIKIELGGVAVTTGVTVDGAAVTADAFGRFTFANTNWHLVTVPIASTTQVSVTIWGGGTSNGRSRYYLDDVSVMCSSSLLEAQPNIGGLTYVSGLGPSSTRTVVINGTDMPTSNGTITLSGLGNFELSFDGGTTWSSGASASFTYTGTSFSKLAMVRLKAGLAVNTYTATVTVNGGGYTKIAPTVTFSGSVTNVPSTEACGDVITLLNLNGTGATLNLVDEVTGTSWVSSDAVSANSHIVLESTMTSPIVSLDNYDLNELTLFYQPYGGTGRDLKMSYSSDGGASYTGDTLMLGPSKVPYSVTYDLSKRGIKDFFSLKFSINAASKYLELWNIKVTGTPKKIIETTTPVLSGFTSYVNCPSDPQTLTFTGKCLVDNGLLTFTSTYYEFSADGVTYGSSVAYTGSFPLLGLKVYVRQKGATTGGSTINEQVTVTNGSYGGFYTLYLSGSIPSLAISSPTEGEVFNFTTTTGVASTQFIDIDAGTFCSNLVASTSYSGVTLSTCQDGTYASTATFLADSTTRRLYLKFTPGTLSNCTVTLTSGTLTRTIYVNWNGIAVAANAIIIGSASVDVPSASYGFVSLTKTGSLAGTTPVTITSSAGASSKFNFSLGNPAYGDFVAGTTYKLADLGGTLYIQPKSGATVGTTETITIAASGATSAVFTVTVK